LIYILIRGHTLGDGADSAKELTNQDQGKAEENQEHSITEGHVDEPEINEDPIAFNEEQSHEGDQNAEQHVQDSEEPQTEPQELEEEVHQEEETAEPVASPDSLEELPPDGSGVPVESFPAETFTDETDFSQPIEEQDHCEGENEEVIDNEIDENMEDTEFETQIEVLEADFEQDVTIEDYEEG
jgi:hypothetical protein